MTALLPGAVCSAVLMTVAFPKPALWFLAPFALVPLLFAIHRKPAAVSCARVFAACYACAAAWQLASLWWIGYVTIAGMLALCLFVALIVAGALTLSWWLTRRGVPLWLSLPAAWMTYEAVVSYLMTGFPWLALGYTWQPRTAAIQIADLAGVYGVSFVIIAGTAAVTQLLCALTGSSPFRPAVTALAIAGAAMAGSLAYGAARLGELDREAPERSITLACVQANIPSNVKHDPRLDADILRRHAYWTCEAAASNVDVILWSETALPGYFHERGLSYHTVTGLVRRTGIPLLTGMATYDYRNGAITYHNSACIIGTNALPGTAYDKMHLVVFGEYVPFEKYLPFLKLVTPIEGSFSAGSRPVLLELDTARAGRVSFGPLICFEDVFGYMARLMASAGADILVNLTNDGWFRSSPGPYQHAALSTFRAVETRRPLVRATNSGVTLAADRAGRITHVLTDAGRRTELAGMLVADIPVHAPRTTFYAAHGDWFLVLSCIVLVATTIAACLRRVQA